MKRSDFYHCNLKCKHCRNWWQEQYFYEHQCYDRKSWFCDKMRARIRARALRAAGHYLFSELEGTGSLFTRHGLFVICLLKVEEDCCSKMKTKSFQHYILTVTHFPLGSGMLKRPYSHFRTTIFFNFQQTYDK